MKTYTQFISECYYFQEDVGEKFAAMDDKQFADWVKGSPQNAERAKKMRDAARARQSAKTPKSGTQSNPNQNAGPNAYQRGKQKVKDIYNRAKTAKANASQTYQNIKDTVKNKAKQAASTAYNASPKDAVNAAKKATANVKNAAKTAVSDATTKVKYGKTVRPDTTGASSLAKRSSALSNVSKASKALRIAGRVAGPAAAAIDVAAEKSKGSGWARSLAKGAVTAAGGALGGAAGSVAGPVGTVAGGVGGAAAASKAFDVAAGANAKERKAMATANRQKQSGTAIKGIGGPTSFDTKKNTMTTGSGSQRKTVALAKTGVVQRGGQSVAGNLAYKGGKAVYKAGPSAQSLAKTSSNPLERIGRSLFAGAYKQHDAAKAKQALSKARQSDAARNKALGVKFKPAG
jgi:hypothetical protein